MANNLQNTSGKSARRDKSKSLRQTVIQVRMNDEEIALLDNKRGTESRSRFLRHALYGGAENRHKSMDVRVPDIERMTMALNRFGVNVNQIARRCNAEAKNARPWSTTSKQTCTSEEMKTLEACQKELHDLNDKLARMEDAIRKQTMELQLCRLTPEVRAMLEGFGDSTYLPDLVDELLADERQEVGGDAI